MGERKQDVWLVVVTSTASGVTLSEDRGVIDLPRPMTAFEAADYAVRVGVRDAVKMGASMPVNLKIEATVFGRYESGADGRKRECTALAEYDADRDVFKRMGPWRGDGCWTEVGATEGAHFGLMDWS